MLELLTYLIYLEPYSEIKPALLCRNKITPQFVDIFFKHIQWITKQEDQDSKEELMTKSFLLLMWILLSVSHALGVSPISCIFHIRHSYQESWLVLWSSLLKLCCSKTATAFLQCLGCDALNVDVDVNFDPIAASLTSSLRVRQRWKTESIIVKRPESYPSLAPMPIVRLTMSRLKRV